MTVSRRRPAAATLIGTMGRPTGFQLVTPAFGTRHFTCKQRILLMLMGGTPGVVAVLCTTVWHSVTQISHNPQELNVLPIGNMKDSMSMKLLVYETASGRRPFVEWFERLDGQCQRSVRRRLRAIEDHDHLGVCTSLRGGLYEMRLAGRMGLRVYFANIDGAVVLLLGGSGKGDQKRAINHARDRLKDFRERNSE